MGAFPFDSAFDLVSKVVDKIFPDPVKRDEAKYKLIELAQNGELAKLQMETQLALGQIEVNKEEAKSDSLFKSGWRPSVGWICSAGLGYQFLARPLFSWYASTQGLPTAPPLELGDLLTLLFGMLGLGAYRSYDKKVGTS